MRRRVQASRGIPHTLRTGAEARFGSRICSLPQRTVAVAHVPLSSGERHTCFPSAGVHDEDGFQRDGAVTRFNAGASYRRSACVHTFAWSADGMGDAHRRREARRHRPLPGSRHGCRRQADRARERVPNGRVVGANSTRVRRAVRAGDGEAVTGEADGYGVGRGTRKSTWRWRLPLLASQSQVRSRAA